jgi:phospholipase/carboxylesterase
MMKTDLIALEKLPLDGEAPDYAVVMLHGYGSNAEDLFSLSPLLQSFQPRLAIISVQAPEVLSWGSYSWFDLTEWHGAGSDVSLFGPRIALTADCCAPWILARLQSMGVALERSFLLGFSQGAMVSAELALEHWPTIGGVFAFSGCLVRCPPRVDRLLADRVEIDWIHGESDEVVPFGMMEHSLKPLRDRGWHPRVHRFPGMGHSIDRNALAVAGRVLAGLPLVSRETGGVSGLDPARFGDWQHKGRVSDF